MGYYQRDNSCPPKTLRKPGVTIMQQILRTIKLDPNLKEENNLILEEFLSTFIEEMKRRDELFREVFQNVHYTGSFYSDLRISEPNEFDINIVLKMPFKPSEFIIECFSSVPSYAMYCVKNQHVSLHDSRARLLTTFFQDGYLFHVKVRRWMQAVVQKALSTYTLPRDVLHISQKESGPARTLRLQKNKGFIDIDLVPVVSCCFETLQPGTDPRISRRIGHTLEVFMVPKPCPNPPGIYADLRAEQISRLWRLHYPLAENELIHDCGCLKPVIKLLKLLRDEEDWKILASYYLKTVVMWMVLENPSKDYWKQDKIDERFIEALRKLQTFVNFRNIPYFFDKNHNLIAKMNNNESIKITNRLSVIIRDAHNDPTNFWWIFGVQPYF